MLGVVDSTGIASVSMFVVFQETLASFNQPYMTDAICSLICLYTLVTLLQSITIWNQIRLLLRSSLIRLNSVCFQSKNILECNCSSCKKSGPKNIGRIIRIYHECEGRIEKSILRISVWHQEAC